MRGCKTRLASGRATKPLYPNAVGTVGFKVVAIAASTGGPRALRVILKSLPPELPAAVVVAQHIADGFSKSLVDWLASECSILIKEGSDGEMLSPGQVWIAPSGFHMTVERGPKLALKRALLIHNQRPSASLLLQSVALSCGANAIGVILSGMGDDGVEGLRAIKEAGGVTLAQDEESCAVYGMPRAAVEMGVVDKVVPLHEIAGEILRLVQ